MQKTRSYIYIHKAINPITQTTIC